jgi:hypothetical protein
MTTDIINLADMMMQRYQEQTIPTGLLYRGITYNSYLDARESFIGAVTDLELNSARYLAIRDFLVEGSELDRLADERIKSMEKLK